MVNELAVESKTDGELLEIWEHQTDYVADVVTRVQAEIERRKLDTSAIRVIPLEEVEKKKEDKSDRTLSRLLALVNGFMGLSAVFVFLDSDKSTENLVFLVVGLLLIVLSIGIWLHKRWALISGLILYAIAAVSSIVGTVGAIARVAFLRNTRLIEEPFVTGILGLLITLFMAAGLNLLRKRARMTGAKGE